MRRTNLLSWIGLVLAAAYLVGFGAWAVFANGLEQLVLGAPFYVAPLVAVALILRSSNSVWRIVAGVFALLGAVYFFFPGVVGLVVGDWQEKGLFAIGVPLIAYYVVVFWATVLPALRTRRPVTPMTS